MKYSIEKLNKPPISGDYEEILFDLPSPWREPLWNYVLFATSSGQKWCGGFRAKDKTNFLVTKFDRKEIACVVSGGHGYIIDIDLSLIHISEPTRLGMISYAVFCL